jgi:UDPglucose 6-dehydrogenase
VNVTVFGIGYVGLVTGACLAETGNDVICVDIDPARVKRLEEGHLPIYEPGLEDIVRKNIAAGRLHFTTDERIGVDHGLYQFIAVNTPPADDGSADLRNVLTVAGQIGTHMNGYRIVVNKSTVPVGTAEKVEQEIREILSSRNKEVSFDVVSNPEFLKEGAAVADFMRPDRIVVGARDHQAFEHMRRLYRPFNWNHEKLIEMDPPSAELTKYAANAMLATKISFMNEMANIAGRLGADIEQVRLGIGADPRIGFHFIYPGCGYGGSCFPKDIRALSKTAEGAGYGARLLAAVEEVNAAQKKVLAEKILRHFDGDIAGRQFALWGLAFKPNTDDMREAPSRAVIDALTERGATVVAYDPVAREDAQRLYGDNGNFRIVDARDDVLAGSDALIIVTEWKEFRSPDYGAIKDRLNSPIVFDGRNIFDPREMETLGIRYYAIGRGLSQS